LAEEARKQGPNDATLLSFLGYYYSEIGAEKKASLCCAKRWRWHPTILKSCTV
jgi:hypothetical protein